MYLRAYKDSQLHSDLQPLVLGGSAGGSSTSQVESVKETVSVQRFSQEVQRSQRASGDQEQ